MVLELNVSVCSEGADGPFVYVWYVYLITLNLSAG